MRALVSVWDQLSPAEREAKLKEIINKQLAKSGTPEVEVEGAALNPGSNGQFDFTTWKIEVQESVLKAAGPMAPGMGKGVANTVLHEGRHAEQWFAAMRRMAARGKDAAAISLKSGAPLYESAAAAANPLAATGSPIGVLGEATRKSVYGSAAKARDSILTKSKSAVNAQDPRYQRYRGLPEEQDAFATGNQTNNNCV